MSKTEGEAGRWTGSESDKLTVSQTDGQTISKTEGEAGRWTESESDGESDLQSTCRQADRSIKSH